MREQARIKHAGEVWHLGEMFIDDLCLLRTAWPRSTDERRKKSSGKVLEPLPASTYVSVVVAMFLFQE
jgi:hypothetical protein